MAHSTRRPQGRLTLLGEVVLIFPFSAPLVASLKDRIPHEVRTYDPTRKAWRVWGGFPDVAISILLHHLPSTHAPRKAGIRETREARASGSDPFRSLHLREIAPVELIETSYQVLARLHQPDADGSTEARQAITDANAALREQASG
jgi:hypothetical protein